MPSKNKKVQRIDRQGLQYHWQTKEGFLESYNSNTTRYGIFTYIEDGVIIKELRRPEEVLRAFTLDSMKNKPVTFEHPNEFVNSENAKELSIGFTGTEITIDGQWVQNYIKVTDGSSIEKIDGGDGVSELSWGYECYLINEGGIYNGAPYDREQIDIDMNHLAITVGARAGSEAKLRLDSKGTTNITEDEEAKLKKKPKISNLKNKSKKKKGGTMSGKTVTVNKVDYSDVPVEVANEVTSLRKDSAESEKTITSLRKDNAALEGKVAGAETKLKKLDSNESISKLVGDKLELVETCKPYLKKDSKDLVGSGDRELMTETLLAINPEMKLDSKEDISLLKIRFDSVLSVVSNDAVKEQGKIVLKIDGKDDPDDLDQIRMDSTKAYLELSN